MLPTSVKRYSAIAQFWLVVNGERHRLAQIAPGFIILSRPAPIPAGPATLVINVEGREETSAVRILEDAGSTSDVLRIARDEPRE
jgi:hypothetical protein